MDSQSSVPTHQKDDVAQLRATLDNLMRYSEMSSREENYSGDSGQDRETDSELNMAERKVKAEAKSMRKVLKLLPLRVTSCINVYHYRSQTLKSRTVRSLP